jgi:hypothetical protein
MSLKENILKQLIGELIDSANQLKQLHYEGKIEIETQFTNLGERVSLAEISEVFDSVVMDIETEQEILSFLKNLINYRQDYLANAIPPELIN